MMRAIEVMDVQSTLMHVIASVSILYPYATTEIEDFRFRVVLSRVVERFLIASTMLRSTTSGYGSMIKDNEKRKGGNGTQTIISNYSA